jgi:indolepyruvate ferredoxin oxidoreductase beta subunit
MHNVLFCGVGGQGVLTAAEICGVAAMGAGHHVKKSEVHGMAQRGGSVESHVRFGDQVYSPLIAPGTADLIVCFDKGEGERMAHYLRPGGTSFLPYLTNFEETGENRRFLNTYLLGILSAYLPMDQEHWLTALEGVFKRAKEENRRVFQSGADAGAAELGTRAGATD